MSNMFQPRPGSQVAAQSSSAVLVQFMNGVYAWMCAGLCVTGIAALLMAQSGVHLSGGVLIMLFLAELGLVVAISGMVDRLSASAATGLFMLYAALNGITLSVIFTMYSSSSIGGAFLITAGMFGATSFYGMVTKRDLSGLGGYLFMALIGIILASIVNFFMQSSMLNWLISYVGVAVFVGLTAYDTQRLREMAYATAGDSKLAARLAVTGSLVLYLDFINLLLFVLRIMGDKRR